MKLKYASWLGAFIGLMICSTCPLFGANSIYLNIPNIPGEVTASGYANQIAVYTFTTGIANNVTVGAVGTPGNATFNDIVITKPLDEASPLLYLNCAENTSIAGPVVMTVVRSGTPTAQVLYTLKLYNVYIKSVATSSTDGSGTMQETLTLVCGKIEWSYQTYNSNGTIGSTITHNWDILKNTGS